MKKNIIYRENHKQKINEELNENYKIFTDHFNKKIKQLDFLYDLLKDIEGSITLKGDHNHSWYEYKIIINYRNHNFIITEDYKNKINIFLNDIYKYNQPLIYNQELKTWKEENKPLNYTFWKLTTKKLIQLLDYKINLLLKITSLYRTKENTNNKVFNKNYEILLKISKYLQTPIKHRHTDNINEYWINTPFGYLTIKKDKQTLTNEGSYEIKKHLEYINMILNFLTLYDKNEELNINELIIKEGE